MWPSDSQAVHDCHQRYLHCDNGQWPQHRQQFEHKVHNKLGSPEAAPQLKFDDDDSNVVCPRLSRKPCTI